MSAHKYLRVPGVSARFGTDPFFWNWAMWLTARLVPRSKLNDREFVRAFARLSEPFVRQVDTWAGEAVVSGGLLLAGGHLLAMEGLCTLGLQAGSAAGMPKQLVALARLTSALICVPLGSSWRHLTSDPRTPAHSHTPHCLQAMRIEVDFEGGKNAAGLFVHRYLGQVRVLACTGTRLRQLPAFFQRHTCHFFLVVHRFGTRLLQAVHTCSHMCAPPSSSPPSPQSMGYSVGGFARAVLLGQTKPGVWYPEVGAHARSGNEELHALFLSPKARCLTCPHTFSPISPMRRSPRRWLTAVASCSTLPPAASALTSTAPCGRLSQSPSRLVLRWHGEGWFRMSMSQGLLTWCGQ